MLNLPVEKRIGLANRFLESRIIRRVFPEIGRIKIGEKKAYEKEGREIEIPVRLDHFIITKNIRDENKKYIYDFELMKKVASLTNQDPNKLTQIPIIFPFETPELNFQIWFMCYKDKGIFCRGDGKIALRGQEYVECPCERYNYPENHPERCRLYGRLHCFIKGANQFGGVWVFRTRSIRTIETLWRQMKQFYTITGGLSGFVFILNLNQESVALPTGQTHRIYTVSLLYDPRYDDLQDSPLGKLIEKAKMMKEKKVLRVEEEKKMLEWYATHVLEEEEKLAKEIQEEFFPEPEVQEIAKEVLEEPKEVQLPRKETIPAEETKVIKLEKLERIERKDVKKANVSQIKLLRDEIVRFAAANKLPEEELRGCLEILDTLTYEEITPLVRLVMDGKVKEAYEEIKKIITAKIPRTEISNHLGIEEIIDDDLFIEEIEDELDL